MPLPEKLSIAVLPFTNLSGDPEQDYFADGMVEEIITALSRLRWLLCSPMATCQYLAADGALSKLLVGLRLELIRI